MQGFFVYDKTSDKLLICLLANIYCLNYIQLGTIKNSQDIGE